MKLDDLIRIREIIFEGENKRDILIFQLLFGTGCRVPELINLELGDIEIVNPSYGFIEFKNSKSAKSTKSIMKIVITEELIKNIRDYLEIRSVSESNKLLIGQKGPMTRHTINKLFREYSLMANIEYTVSPNMIRRMGILIRFELSQSESLELSYIPKFNGHLTTKNYISKWSELGEKYINLWWEKK